MQHCPAACALTPFVGFVFVGEAYRGRRISERLIAAASAYAGSPGFAQICLTSGERGRYEKYGFRLIGSIETVWGEQTQLFCRSTAAEE